MSWIRKTAQVGLLSLTIAFTCTTLARASENEAEQRDAFMKEYKAAQFPDDRKKTLVRLTGAQDPATQKVLFNVAIGDQDEGVRTAAFVELCSGFDRDGSLSLMIANAFKNEKDNNKEAKAAMAKAMRNLNYKYEPLGALVTYILHLRYPNMPNDPGNNNNNNNNNGGGGGGVGGIGGGLGGGNREMAKKNQDYYAGILGDLNALSGEKFVADPKTNESIKKWWDAMGQKYALKDHELKLQKNPPPPPMQLTGKPDANKPAAKEPAPDAEGGAKTAKDKKDLVKDVLDKKE